MSRSGRIVSRVWGDTYSTSLRHLLGDVVTERGEQMLGVYLFHNGHKNDVDHALVDARCLKTSSQSEGRDVGDRSNTRWCGCCCTQYWLMNDADSIEEYLTLFSGSLNVNSSGVLLLQLSELVGIVVAVFLQCIPSTFRIVSDFNIVMMPLFLRRGSAIGK